MNEELGFRTVSGSTSSSSRAARSNPASCDERSDSKFLMVMPAGSVAGTAPCWGGERMKTTERARSGPNMKERKKKERNKQTN
jgi:hypothetical protein